MREYSYLLLLFVFIAVRIFVLTPIQKDMVAVDVQESHRRNKLRNEHMRRLKPNNKKNKWKGKEKQLQISIKMRQTEEEGVMHHGKRENAHSKPLHQPKTSLIDKEDISQYEKLKSESSMKFNQPQVFRIPIEESFYGESGLIKHPKISIIDEDKGMMQSNKVQNDESDILQHLAKGEVPADIFKNEYSESLQLAKVSKTKQDVDVTIDDELKLAKVSRTKHDGLDVKNHDEVKLAKVSKTKHEDLDVTNYDEVKGDDTTDKLLSFLDNLKNQNNGRKNVENSEKHGKKQRDAHSSSLKNDKRKTHQLTKVSKANQEEPLINKSEVENNDMEGKLSHFLGKLKNENNIKKPKSQQVEESKIKEKEETMFTDKLQNDDSKTPQLIKVSKVVEGKINKEEALINKSEVENNDMEGKLSHFLGKLKNENNIKKSKSQQGEESKIKEKEETVFTDKLQNYDSKTPQLIKVSKVVEEKNNIDYGNLKKEKTKNSPWLSLSNMLKLNPKQEDEYQEHCIVNVHGFHHTGTGFLRSTIYESFGSEKMSKHEKTHSVQHEGHKLQSVYPSYKEREENPNICGSNIGFRQRGKLYYCPSQLNKVNDANKKTLFREWSRYWEMKKPYLIQKSATFDVLLLEKLKITPTFHAIIMRHPLIGRGQGIRPFELPLVWLDTWTNIFEQVLQGEIESFAIINYEMLLSSTDDLSKELFSMITKSCSIQSNERRKVRRNLRRYLNLRNKKYAPKFTYGNLSDLEKHFWDSCEKRSECIKVVKHLAPLMYEFGYTVDRSNFFNSKKVETRMSKILFSNSKLPSAGLVRQMRELVDKFIR